MWAFENTNGTKIKQGYGYFLFRRDSPLAGQRQFGDYRNGLRIMRNPIKISCQDSNLSWGPRSNLMTLNLEIEKCRPIY